MRSLQEIRRVANDRLAALHLSHPEKFSQGTERKVSMIKRSRSADSLIGYEVRRMFASLSPSSRWEDNR